MSSGRTTGISRTNLSGHAGTLRLSLLVALGFSHAACGGTVVSTSGEPSGGTSAQGGTDPGMGGSSYSGGLPGGYLNASGTSYGGQPEGGGVGQLCSSPSYDPNTGLTTCNNGIVHRPMHTLCAYESGNGGEGGAAGDNGAAGDSDAQGDSGAGGIGATCTTNAQCSNLRYGWCDLGYPLDAHCKAGCRQDSDCGNGGLCQCDSRTPAGRCVFGGCQVDGDCGPNSLCIQIPQACDFPTFQCSKGADECRLGSSDCPDGFCETNAQGRNVCHTAVCGRPFIVADLPRWAAVASRADWLDDSLTPNLAGLTPLERAERAAHWARLGQMEHASIAAFARFNLQLLSLGAPSELVEACNRALADETRHTRLCFALASSYAGLPLGPSKLEVRDCFDDTSLAAIMKLVLREGCLGETGAALEARADAALATDPVVEEVLLRIAHDEQAHAELGFRFLAWALTQSSDEARLEIAHEAELRLAELEREAQNPVQRVAAREVVGPLLNALFAEHLAQGQVPAQPLL
ncbi:MAG: ferritin-like domain-containing protein [Myxococcales bacterium]